MTEEPTAGKAPRKTAARGKESTGFSAEERAAMREHAREQKAAAAGANDESAVIEKIAAMPEPDRTIADGLHALIRSVAPELAPRTWYGMPAYAKAGKVLCFVQAASKFKTRYSTLGFSDQAALDGGAMWPTGFAVKELTPQVEAEVTALLNRALGR